jgi:hypothetical protein
LRRKPFDPILFKMDICRHVFTGRVDNATDLFSLSRYPYHPDVEGKCPEDFCARLDSKSLFLYTDRYLFIGDGLLGMGEDWTRRNGHPPLDGIFYLSICYPDRRYVRLGAAGLKDDISGSI